MLYLYFSVLTILIYLAAPEGYLLDIPTSYILKNQLHATAAQVATFRLLTAIPLYLAFVFGFVRDRWNPLGRRDPGYFLVFGPITAAVFIWIALSPVTFQSLFIGMLLVMLSFRLIMAAYQGLMALAGQEKLMTGRVGMVWQIGFALLMGSGALGSGWISEHLSSRGIFLLMAALVLLIAVMGFWRPRAVFSNAYAHQPASNLFGDVRRLIRHAAIYPAILINVLWNFNPGTSTPLQFYLTNRLHASDAMFANFTCLNWIGAIPSMLLYGYLCKKTSFRKLLWVSAIVAVPCTMPLAFVDSANLAVLIALPMSLMGGMAYVAFADLALRSCPPGLQGTLMMLVSGLSYLAYRGGDVFGSWIYGLSETRGFLYCAISVTVVYALILPVLLLLPKDLAANAGGEPSLAKIKETQ